MKHLLDTNHADTLLKDPGRLRDRLLAVPAGDAVLCRPSVGELWFMVHNSGRMPENRRKLLNVLAAYPVVEFDAAAAEEFGRIKSEQRRSGKAIPPIDAQIAAIARVHSLVVLTADKHFGFIDGIKVENWLAE